MASLDVDPREPARWTAGEPYTIVLFYRYVSIVNPEAEVLDFRCLCERLGLLGRILLATEGINGTLAGSSGCIDAFVAHCSSSPRFSRVDWKLTSRPKGDENLPFLNLSVRTCNEIISTGSEGKSIIDAAVRFDEETFGGLSGTGTHLTPTQFHEALIAPLEEDEERVVIDVRNQFEHDVGRFRNALPLGTVTYAESWKALEKSLHLDKQQQHNEQPQHDEQQQQQQQQLQTKKKSFYMYCTGGIRCEKASAFLKAKGIENVYQLQGGIHRYLEEYPDGGEFCGKNFVFDSRAQVAPEHAPDAAERSVVGQCLSCRASHERFTGTVCCTVCLQPLLLCPTCVASTTPPGEYHCFKHVWLKHVYFSSLERFTIEELCAQRDALFRLEQELLSEKQRGKNKRRTLRRQQQKIEARIAYVSKHRQEAEEEARLIPERAIKTRVGTGFWQD